MKQSVKEVEKIGAKCSPFEYDAEIDQNAF